MRIIFKIAKAELRSLFYSPVAWVIAVAFFMLCGSQFAEPLVTFASYQQFNLENLKDWRGFNTSLTMDLFKGAYKYLLENLFLFMPLLTMGVVSREVHAGTIRLLSSSPVRTRDIVLGKYLGLVIYNAILMLPIALLMLTGSFSVVSVEYKLFLSALLGIFMLCCTYSAIGLFISSITNYQVVAALCTFLLFFVLSYINMLWQQHDFFRDLTWFLNITGRVEMFLVGLISTKDLAYFLLIIGLFVGFTLIKLYNRQESKKWYFFFARYLALMLVVLALGYATSRPSHTGYWDVTREQVNTIHPVVQEVVKELGNEPLKVTLYVNVLTPEATMGFPAERNKYIWNFWGSYLRFHPNIDFDFVYYYDLLDGDTLFRKNYPNKTLDEVARKFVKMYGLPQSVIKTPAQIRKALDLGAENMRLVMQLEYKGKKTFLRTYDDPKFWPDQLHVAAAISRLTRDTIPKIYFSSGHYERSPYKTGEREYANHALQKMSRGALLNLGVQIDTLNLSTQDIPASSVLVVADPKSALSLQEQEKVIQHLSNGGDAMFYGEPGKQHMLNGMLKYAGVTLDDGVVVSPNKQDRANLVYALITDSGLYLADENLLWVSRPLHDTIIMTIDGMASLSYEEGNGFRIEPVLEPISETDMWKERGVFVPDSAAPDYSAAEGDVKEKKYVTAIKISRQLKNREQRIVVAGDADFMSAIRGSGSAMGNAAYSWLLRNEYPFYTNYQPPKDRMLTIGRKMSKYLRFIFVYVLPAMVLAAGTILLIRRKRK